MATRLKTVKFGFPVLASLTSGTLTNLPQITVYLPESSKTFRSVVAHITFSDSATTAGNITANALNLRVGAAAYTSVANTNALTNSGENASPWVTADFTSHFTTNWSGSSMTCDFQAQITSAGTPTTLINVCVTLDITYAYDDTSATHIKTVMIPLNAPVGTMATTATTYDTIPALDTYLPEASKAYRNIYLVLQGNIAFNTTTTSCAVTMKVGTASEVTGTWPGTLASDQFIRYVYSLTTAYPSTAATQVFQPITSVTNRFNHFQAYLVVTYEFSPSTTTSVMNSMMLPMDLSSPMGGTTSSDYQRGSRELWIEEPGTITTSRVAFYPFWQQINSISTLNMRIGTGSFVAYTDIASVLCGSNAAMVRNDSAFTLARGRNKLNFDVWRSDAADFGWNLCGFWLVNYTSGIATAGIGAHNHTVEWGLLQRTTTAVATNYTVATTALVIPETDYLITALGTQLIVQSSGTVAPSGYTVLIERLAAEGGAEWEAGYIDSSQTDPEIGAFLMYSQIRTLFGRFPGDVDPSRMDITTGRRWRVHINGSTAVSGWIGLNIMMTYHAITYNVADTITGGFNGTVTIGLHRSEANTSTPGELVKTVTRTGAGAFSFTWYDNTEAMYVTATDIIGTVGRSQDSLAA